MTKEKLNKLGHDFEVILIRGYDKFKCKKCGWIFFEQSINDFELSAISMKNTHFEDEEILSCDEVIMKQALE